MPGDVKRGFECTTIEVRNDIMGFIESIKSGFIRYFDFTTRSSRSEYWWWILFTWFVSIILAVVSSTLFGPTIEQTNTGGTTYSYGGGILGAIFALLVLIPSIAISCRRLHDIDKSGWWQLIAFIPLIGVLILLYWFIKSGNVGQNRFGANPLVSAA